MSQVLTAFAALEEPACCGLPNAGNHSRLCPLAIGQSCEDCGEEAGLPCFPFCSSMLGQDDDPGVLAASALVFIDPYSAGAAGIWGRVCDLILPVIIPAGLLGFTLDDSAPQEAYSISAARHAVNDACYVGWVDAGGLRVILRHPRARLTPGMVLAARHLMLGTAESVRDLVAVPVKLYVTSDVGDSPGHAECVCGHPGREHNGSGVAAWSCTRTRDGFQWCDCLHFRPAVHGGGHA